ncbi:Head morphogenesis protein SPP1 gp7 (fragment) [uncultured Desulfobacterium sp.]|uniref:Head morphogenesis protein SPP1 gp7 n=1 Tax=uncultured Desulfobacterium sp. TaxID=201089 RepID=A0A445MWE4_9BACT
MGISFPGQVPSEAIAFIKNKALKVGFSYLDVWREEHSFAFTVAKAMQLDILRAIRDEIVKALNEGRTFEQFKKELTPTLQKLGWWGERPVMDPLSAKVKTAQLGSPRRLKTIYDTNMRQARSAGQWERIQRTKAALPYLRYGLGPSLEHRMEHAAWDGMTLPVDDPWWDSHMPMNGWGCKCRVRQVSQREMDRNGWKITTPPPDNPKEWINKRTGEVQMVPEGIDPGFDYNPGKDRQRQYDKMIRGKLQEADPVIAKAAEKHLRMTIDD